MTVAEGGVRLCNSCHDRLLQWGRNLTVAEGMDAFERLFKKSKLQWGRNLTVAEGADDLLGTFTMKSLQWGRNLTVAEGLAAQAIGDRRRATSMGPQLDSCGRKGLISRLEEVKATSMGPQLDSCGRIIGIGYRGKTDLLQWGRNLTVAEGLDDQERDQDGSADFNGAAT